MATAYSQPLQYTPYQEQWNKELLGKALQYKQDKYDTNRQVIKNTIAQVSNIDLLKDQDAEYLYDRLQSVINNLNTQGAGDLSLESRADYLTGYIADVADQKVMNGYVGTRAYRNIVAEHQEKLKTGEASDLNLAFSLQDVSSWANDGQVGSALPAGANTSYVPYVDLYKSYEEIAQNLEPGSYVIWDQFGDSGFTWYSRKDEELAPERLVMAFNLATQSNQKLNDQLRVNAWGANVSVSDAQFVQEFRNDAQNDIDGLKAYVEQLRLGRAALLSDSEKELVDANIAAYEAQIAMYNQGLSASDEEILANKEAYQFAKYKENYLMDLAGVFSYTKMGKPTLEVDQGKLAKYKEQQANARAAANRQLERDKMSLENRKEINKLLIDGMKEEDEDIQRMIYENGQLLFQQEPQYAQSRGLGNMVFNDEGEYVGFQMLNLDTRTGSNKFNKIFNPMDIVQETQALQITNDSTDSDIQDKVNSAYSQRNETLSVDNLATLMNYDDAIRINSMLFDVEHWYAVKKDGTRVTRPENGIPESEWGEYRLDSKGEPIYHAGMGIHELEALLTDKALAENSNTIFRNISEKNKKIAADFIQGQILEYKALNSDYNYYARVRDGVEADMMKVVDDIVETMENASAGTQLKLRFDQPTSGSDGANIMTWTVQSDGSLRVDSGHMFKSVDRDEATVTAQGGLRDSLTNYLTRERGEGGKTIKDNNGIILGKMTYAGRGSAYTSDYSFSDRYLNAKQSRIITDKSSEYMSTAPLSMVDLTDDDAAEAVASFLNQNANNLINVTASEMKNLGFQNIGNVVEREQMLILANKDNIDAALTAAGTGYSVDGDTAADTKARLTGDAQIVTADGYHYIYAGQNPVTGVAYATKVPIASVDYEEPNRLHSVLDGHNYAVTVARRNFTLEREISSSIDAGETYEMGNLVRPTTYADDFNPNLSYQVTVSQEATKTETGAIQYGLKAYVQRMVTVNGKQEPYDYPNGRPFEHDMGTFSSTSDLTNFVQLGLDGDALSQSIYTAIQGENDTYGLSGLPNQ